MGEISAASNEQATGVAQVGEAVTQMDQSTQQNAALVEEMAAAASSLKGQANELVQAVAFFQLGGQQATRAPGAGLAKAAVRSATPPAVPFKGPERRAQGASAGAGARATAKPAAPRATPASATAAPVKTAAKPAPTGGDDDWETF
jgi:hypothetical protein